MAGTTKTELQAQLAKLQRGLAREKAKAARHKKELAEALQRQTATAEILKVISESPSDVQPVLEAIAKHSMRLLGGLSATVTRRVGDALHLGALTSTSRSADDALRKSFPFPLTEVADRRGPLVEGVITRESAQVADTEAARTPQRLRQMARQRGYRSILAVPMVSKDEAIGTISVTRREPGKFSNHDIELLKTFADQAVIAIENVRQFNETKEALERQRATAEVLGSISGSMTDTQPVFERIVQNVRRLFGTRFAVLQLLHDRTVEMVAVDGDPGFEKLRDRYPRPLDDSTVGGRAMLSKQAFQLAPVLDNPAAPEATVQFARDFGFNSVIFSPMIRDGKVIGAIGAAHPGAKPFDERQIALIKTFADQAVIAIQNVRLFNETKEALERQTATAEILKVISSSPTNIQPVLDAVAANAAHLCDATDVVIQLAQGDVLRSVAHYGAIPYIPIGAVRPVTRGRVTGRAVLEGRQIHVRDLQAESDEYPEGSAVARQLGTRTTLVTPLLREETAIGTIFIRRTEVRPFSDKQLALVRTFADQAVIAIENVRLFNETKEALEQQTATAEILRVISSTPTEAQPVFDAIVQSALRIFSGTRVGIILAQGDRLRVVASAGDFSRILMDLAVPRSRESASGMAIVERSVVNIPDTEAPDVPKFARENGRAHGFRAIAAAPLLREGDAIGAITVFLEDTGGLSDKQLALLKTFADQAVIAIENTRLFKELEARTEALSKSVGQLTALGEVSQAISSTLDLEKVLQTIVERAVQLTELDSGSIYEFDADRQTFHLRGARNIPLGLVEMFRREPIRIGEGAVGLSGMSREPVQVPDILAENYQTRARDLLIRSGARALLAVPLLREGHILGALAVTRNAPGAFAPEVVDLLRTFATQSAIAIQNARLFREIEEKGRQLEEASRHKSDFLASMSHELRTPLNAILGFNEMILDGVYGEPPPDMMDPLADVQTSGKHLLRLINNVLDLAKIEAGRMELALADYSVQDMVESVRATLRPLAEAKGLEFLASVPQDLPLAHGDSGRLTQCLMNLAGNSLKFTRAGRVSISVESNDGATLLYRVADTGIGIPPDKIGSLFTEFRQTDATIASEYGGTGLGLSITRKFVEMHGGRIWVESEPGQGSVFIFEVPLRAQAV